MRNCATASLVQLISGISM